MARIIAYYPDYAVPDWPGGMFIDRQWFDSFMRNCAQDGVAIVAMCWFTGTREELEHKGEFNEWKAIPAATFGEYKLACNEAAKHQLEKLPEQGAVFFEFATPTTWWRIQQQGRKWDERLDRSHQIAYYDPHGIRLESRVAVPQRRQRAAAAGPTWFTYVRLLIWIPWLIYWLSHSCAGTPSQ